MPNPKFSFNIQPKEAIAYLKDKGFKQSFNYEELMHDAHHRSFTIAKMMNDDLLKDVHGSLLKAQEDGIGFKEWKKNIIPTLKSKGWYGETEVFNPKTGEFKTIFVGSRRLRTIYETNMRVSHAVGRYKKMMSLPLSKYWMYISMLLPTTRHSHAGMHGTVLPRDDTWWDTNYPPNDYLCKCKVRAYSKRDLEKRGIEVAATSPKNIATKDWAYHVGKTDTQNLKSLRDKKILDAPKDLKPKAKASAKLDDIYTKTLETMPLTLSTYLLKNRPKMALDIKSKTYKGPTAQYDPNTQKITFFEKNPEAWELRHELSHHIDKINGWISLDAISKSVSIERKSLKKVDAEVLKEMLSKHNDPALYDLIRLHYPVLVGLDTRPKGINSTNILIKETFANISEVIMSGDERMDIIKKYFPFSFRIIKKILENLQ